MKIGGSDSHFIFAIVENKRLLQNMCDYKLYVSCSDVLGVAICHQSLHKKKLKFNYNYY